MELEREPLGEQQSLRLLAGVPVGRVVYTIDALPAVLPVRFRLDPQGCVVLRARARSELVRAVEGALIAFEAGEIDDSDGSGWTVTVLGWAGVEADTDGSGNRPAPPAAHPESTEHTEHTEHTENPANAEHTEHADDDADDADDAEVTIRLRPELVLGQRLVIAADDQAL